MLLVELIDAGHTLLPEQLEAISHALIQFIGARETNSCR